MNTPMNSGMQMNADSASKLPTILVTVLLTAIVMIAGIYVFGFARSGSDEVVVESVTPMPTASTNVSTTPEATTTPTAVTQSKVYSNQYLSVTIPAGWSYSTTQSGAINITKNNYILYINPRAQQASGVVGGRFGEIATGAPSSDAVILEYPGPCHDPMKVSAGVYSRYDYFTQKSNSCEKQPSDGSNVWYFSYMSKDGGYLNYTATIQAPYGYVITMAYNSKDVNKLPKQGNATLNAMLGEMTSIAKTLVINPATGLKTYTNEQYGFEFKYPNSLVMPDTRGTEGQWIESFFVAKPDVLERWKKECQQGCMGSPYLFSLHVDFGKNGTLDQYMQKQGSSSTRVRTTLAGKPAYEEQRGAYDEYYITTENNGKIYILDFHGATGKSNLTEEQQVILSTFKFTK